MAWHLSRTDGTVWFSGRCATHPSSSQYLCAKEMMSEARPLPSQMTTGTGGSSLRLSNIMEMTLGPPSRIRHTTGTPWPRPVTHTQSFSCYFRLNVPLKVETIIGPLSLSGFPWLTCVNLLQSDVFFQLPTETDLGSVLPGGPVIGQDEVRVAAVQGRQLAKWVGHHLVGSSHLRTDEKLVKVESQLIHSPTRRLSVPQFYLV